MRLSDEKISNIFGEYSVKKELVNMLGISRIPRFIAEYLISKFYVNDISNSKQLSDFINVHFPEMKDKDKVLHELMNKGSYTLIDEFKVETMIYKERYNVIIPRLGIYNARIIPSLLDDNIELLRSGLWGMATLQYTRGNDKPDVLISRFTPFQVTNVDLNEYNSKRSMFSREEWIELMIRSIGLNPDVYDEKQRLLLLSRLIPLVEPNCNILELGPKATGKTYLYRNISHHTRVIAGGKISAPMLFYNINSKSAGEIALRDALIFDEINRMRFVNDEIIGKLKDYMVDGFFERGPKKAYSTCSLVFIGNVEEDSLDALPDFMRDSALLDRINGFIYGWNLPKIKQSSEHLAKGYGIVADYLSQIFHQLYLEDYDYIIRENVRFDDLTIRDEKSIVKLGAGLLKIIFPDKRFEREDLVLCIEQAIMLRENVNRLLRDLAPDEFKKRDIKYKII
ncbi:MAG: BREX system Lon protease-like protein BrxL [Candidatus Nitrosocaldaceae archaeon]